MRSAFLLSALLLLAGCAGRPDPRPATGDPLLPGPALPDKGATVAREDDSPRVPPPPPSGDGKASPASLTAPAGTTAGVTLGAPRASVPAPANYAAGPMTYESLQAQLRARSVNWQNLKNRGGESWSFECTVPDPKAPSLSQHYEVTADGPGGLAAIKAVLARIDESRGK